MNGMRWIGVAVLAAASLTGGCAKKSASDQSLAAAVQAKLNADDATKAVASGIKVDAKDGVVTLSGDVPRSDVELAALRGAKAAQGGSRVAAQMEVGAATATAPAYPATSRPPVAAAPATT